MIRSLVILTVILSPNFSVLGFKIKTGLYVIIYHLSLAICEGEQLLRMVLPVFLFKNTHGNNQEHKLKPRIISDRYF